MKQSIGKTNRDKTIALYLRVSRDDKGCDESCSISNQKKLLTGIAQKMGFTNILHFIDDGITGTKRDRKEFMHMISELEKGYISTVVVKDLSRLGRDHIRMDHYIEEFFPEHDIRLIAVAEGLDTAEGEDEFTPFRNLMNEWYARDISKKRKLTNVVKGNAGIPLSLPPYGYLKNPEDDKRWVVDEEAASVIRRIYRMTLSGCGTEQIGAELERDNILTPISYWESKGIKRGVNRHSNEQDNPFKWRASTIVKILNTQEYCGDIINFKTYSKSFKLKRRIPNKPEDMVIFKDVNESIIDRADWEKVQQQRGTMRKRRTNTGERNMFSGLVKCADCGHNLHFHFNQNNPNITYFNCSNYNSNRKACTSTHYIRVDFLEQVVLGEIRKLMQYANKYGNDFVQTAIGFSLQTEEQERARKQKELNAMIARDKELDALFGRMYEDNVMGKISDARFGKLSRQYNEEQASLSERIRLCRIELEARDFKAESIDTFKRVLQKYTRIKKLTPYILNELIDRIEVFQAEKIDGIWRQKLRIIYNGVGSIEIPDLPKIPEIELEMQTRQGVTVQYSPSNSAMKTAI